MVYYAVWRARAKVYLRVPVGLYMQRSTKLFQGVHHEQYAVSVPVYDLQDVVLATRRRKTDKESESSTWGTGENVPRTKAESHVRN